jgi:hypothetical protein
MSTQSQVSPGNRICLAVCSENFQNVPPFSLAAKPLKYTSYAVFRKLRSSPSGAFQKAKAKLSEHLYAVYQRDKAWVMCLDVNSLNNMIWPLFVGYICLNFLDVYTTTLAMNFGPLFHEENPLAAALFDRKFQGYLLALAFKYLPAIPMFYVVFTNDPHGRHQFGIRVVKFSVLIALAGADMMLLYIVGLHNLQSLLCLPL